VPTIHCHVLVEQALTNDPAATTGEIRAFSKCRNERLRLPAFLRHYRALGVNRFFIIDNDSSDGTAEYLADQPDVRLFRTSNRFGEARGGIDWLNALLDEFGEGSWCLTVDIDELLMYPGSESASLRILTDYLDRNGSEAFSCMVLDLYPEGPLRECQYSAGADLIAAAPFFDAEPYHKFRCELCPGVHISGGMRERVFYPEFRARNLRALVDRMAQGKRQRQTLPCLTKVPLVRWSPNTKYLSNHWISPKIVAPDTGVLLHFKFLQDFHVRAVQEAVRGEYYNGAAEYQKYAARVTANPDLTLMHDLSRRFEGTAQLATLGLMHETEAWVEMKGIQKMKACGSE
jgi:glycosyltransferase involved in cell wall biosynthesis